MLYLCGLDFGHYDGATATSRNFDRSFSRSKYKGSETVELGDINQKWRRATLKALWGALKDKTTREGTTREGIGLYRRY